MRKEMLALIIGMVFTIASVAQAQDQQPVWGEKGEKKTVCDKYKADKQQKVDMEKLCNPKKPGHKKIKKAEVPPPAPAPTVIEKTVIEKPTIIEKTIIVERPTIVEKTVVKESRHFFLIGVGGMALYSQPGHTYALAAGGCLDLYFNPTDQWEIKLAGAADPFLHGAFIGQVGVARYFSRPQDEGGNHWLGLSLSAVGAGWSVKKTIDDGFVVGGVPAIIFRPKAGDRNQVVFHFEIGPFLGYSRFTWENGLPKGMEPYDEQKFVYGGFLNTSIALDFSALKD